MAQYELNLRDYFRIFHKRRFIILSIFFVVTAVTWFYFSKQPVTYTATASVQILERKTVSGLLEALVYDPGGDVMGTQTKIVKGFPVIRKVAVRLGLISEDLPTAESVSTENSTTREAAAFENLLTAEVNSVVTRLQGQIETRKIEFTNIIQISVTSASPKYSMDLANTVAEVYIEESLLEKNKQIRSERSFIEAQLARVESVLKEKEDALKAFGDTAQEIRLANPLFGRLVDLELDLAALLQKYTEKHPQVKQIREQIAELEGQVQGTSAKEIEYSQVLREVEVNRKLYSMLREKLEEARISEAQKVGDVNIVDPAVMPGPKRPPIVMGTLAGALMGLILGIGIAFIYETLDTSIGTIEDVESLVKLPVIGIIPAIDPGGEIARRKGLVAKIINRYIRTQRNEAEESYVRLIVHHKPKSAMAEAYRNLRTNLKLTPQIKKLLLVTSAGPREGKSTILANLGLCLAQAGSKVLLIDTDLRRPALAKTFGISRDPGLSEYISGTVKLDEALRGMSDIMLGEMKYEEVIRSPGMENIWILPSGHLPSNPAELLESKEMAGMMDELKKRFDIILMDTPPVLPITDASLLAPKVDGVILCYEIGRTSRDALLRAKVQLESVGAKIYGIVLNHIVPQSESATAYPYYYHYKYGYTYGSEKTKGKKPEQKKALPSQQAGGRQDETLKGEV